MNISLGRPTIPAADQPVLLDEDVEALHDAMQPMAFYTATQLHTAYAAAVRQEGRQPVSAIQLGIRLSRDARFVKRRSEAANLWARS